MTAMRGGISKVESCSKNLAITGTDDAQVFELLQLFNEVPSISHFVKHEHVNKRSRS